MPAQKSNQDERTLVNVRLPDDLLMDLRSIAISEGKSLNQLIIKALDDQRKELTRKKK